MIRYTVSASPTLAGPGNTIDYQEAMLVPIAELHVTDARHVGPGCCWEFDLIQRFGAPGNITYVVAQVTTPGVTVANASGPPGATAPTWTATSITWHTPTPDGLYDLLRA
jgi:hypothetical protein